MERLITIHIEKLPEGNYLATTDDIQGLVPEGNSISETLEIARDVAKKLIEEQRTYRRHAVGSHEIWFNPLTDRYTTIPNHSGEMPEGTLKRITPERLELDLGLEILGASNRVLNLQCIEFTAAQPCFPLVT